MRVLPTLVVLIGIAACTGDDAAPVIVGQLSSDRIEISAVVAEQIIDRPVAEGQRVSENDILIRQDIALVEAQIDEARANLAQTEARLDELVRGPRREKIRALEASVAGASKTLEFRDRERQRAVDVYERKLSSADQRDSAIAAYDTARAELDRLQAQLDELRDGTTPEELRQAQEQVQRAQSQLTQLHIARDRHILRAPIDGIVDSLPFEKGERPVPGQAVVIMLAGRQPHAQVFVPEPLRAQLQAGDSVTVIVDGLTQEFAGQVRWISSDPAFTPYFALNEDDRGRLTYEAKIDLPPTDRRLPDGLPVDVRLDSVRAPE